jgi:hypothetical protein
MNANQTKIFKTSTKYWLQEIGGILLFLVIFPMFAILHWGAKFYLLGFLAILVGILYLFRDIRSVYGAEIIINDAEIKGNVEGFAFVQSWSEVKAVAFSGHGTTSLLLIGSENGVLQISSRFFDRKELEKELKEYLPSDVFDPLAFQRLSQTQRLEQERKRQFDNLREPLKVTWGKSEKTIGSISIFFGFFMVGLSIFSVDKTGPLILAAFLVGLGLFLIVFSIGTIEASNETVVLKTVFQEYELPWNTLREVYINLHNHTIVLTSDKCRIILPSTTSWSGQDREKLYELINVKIETIGISPIKGTKPLYWRSKNF